MTHIEAVNALLEKDMSNKAYGVLSSGYCLETWGRPLGQYLRRVIYLSKWHKRGRTLQSKGSQNLFRLMNAVSAYEEGREPCTVCSEWHEDYDEAACLEMRECSSAF